MGNVDRDLMDYYYIYNLKQSLYFMKTGGIVPEDIGVNPNTKMIYFKFKKCTESQSIFENWRNRKR